MPRSPLFAFLVLEEHPYGREMLRRLLEHGHVPQLVVSERSTVADTERHKFEERITGLPFDAPTIAELCAEHGIATTHVPKHTSARVFAALRAHGLAPHERTARDHDATVEHDTTDHHHRALDLIVLGGTRIVRGPLLDLPRDGVVNSHPGLLPECRGSASPAWSVLHDIPVGATCHLCDSGIDTGDILMRRELDVPAGATYEDLCLGTLVLAGRLMAEVLDAWRDGRFHELRRSQGPSPWPTFRNAPDDVLARVRRKLADGSYAPRR
ncbi:Linear gramicidin synthase subunit A [Planctomycetes bacterium Pla163]|uniref:Linear gramicidin synthase subunit A n=1 Tax=Rohdeia mirabilis TaxID=2528008 RepID=A0A518CVE7_9BACT|nr:Linear gramicidin synthase subunit A [Planctomycetes bacterium Pla163]